MSATRQPVGGLVKAEPAVRWNHRKWGTLEDPIHKSQMSTLIGEYACTKQFQFDRLREARGEDDRETCSGKTEMGTAGHEAIARALRSPTMREAILGGYASISPEQVKRVLLEEFARTCGSREVIWYGKHEHEGVLADVTWMVHGLLHTMHRHVAAVELVEAGFIVLLGEYWLEGHTDLIYRPRSNPEALAFTDWKTGAQKPHQLVLDHGYESGFYSVALERGLFLPVEVLREWRRLAQADAAEKPPLDPWDVVALGKATSERKAMHVALRSLARQQVRGDELPAGVVTFYKFPDEIHQTHLASYVPYAKKGSKTVERPEDVEHWSRVFAPREIKPGDKITYEKGMTRGGAWLPVRRTAADVQRLERLLRKVVSWVRFGLFAEAVGEKCSRCAYRGPCLTSGYELDTAGVKELNAALRSAGFDADAANDLSADDD